MKFWSIAGPSVLLLQFATVAPPPTPAVAPASAAPGPAEALKPVAELERLQFAAGDWVHDKEIDHAGAVGVAKLGSGRSRAAWILAGHALQITYKSKRAEGEYEGRGLATWDAETRHYQLYWFDSLGRVRRFSGELDPAGVLVFSATYSEDGETVRQKISIKKDRNGKYLILDERAIGNAPSTLYVESLAAPAPPAPKATGVPSPSASATTKSTTSP
jgi:hypothetical protein